MRHRRGIACLHEQRGEGGVGAAATSDAGQCLDRILNAQDEVREKEGDDLRDQGHADAEKEQREAVLLDGDQSLRTGSDADDTDEHGQSEIAQEIGSADRQRGKFGCTLRSQPKNRPDSRQPPPLPIEIGTPQILNWIMPISMPISMPMPKKMKSVTCRGGDLIADLWLHPVEIGRAAGEVQFVAALQLKLVEQRQIQPHALDRRQENAVTGVDVDLIVDFADFAAVERTVGQDDFAVFLNQQQTVRRRLSPGRRSRKRISRTCIVPVIATLSPT